MRSKNEHLYLPNPMTFCFYMYNRSMNARTQGGTRIGQSKAQAVFADLLLHDLENVAISPGATIYLCDVHDNSEGCDETVDKLPSECEQVDSEAKKFQAQQMDKTLYTLMVISAIFLPAQFLTGLWGMNYEHMPELDESWGYRMFWIVSSISLTVYRKISKQDPQTKQVAATRNWNETLATITKNRPLCQKQELLVGHGHG